jgi:hypothetical protein
VALLVSCACWSHELAIRGRSNGVYHRGLSHSLTHPSLSPPPTPAQSALDAIKSDLQLAIDNKVAGVSDKLAGVEKKADDAAKGVAAIEEKVDTRVTGVERKVAEAVEGVDANIASQMRDQIRDIMKTEAVADLEKRMHSALDHGLEKIEEVVHEKIGQALEPVSETLAKLKNYTGMTT